MAKLNDELKEKIIAEYKAGISQNQLARIYALSKATINKLCKGKEQDNKEIVNAQVAINHALSQKPKQEVEAINRLVDKKTKILLFFEDSALKNQKLANEFLHQAERMSDIEAHARTTAKNKETVLGKEIDTQINQITQVNQSLKVDWE